MIMAMVARIQNKINKMMEDDDDDRDAVAVDWLFGCFLGGMKKSDDDRR